MNDIEAWVNHYEETLKKHWPRQVDHEKAIREIRVYFENYGIPAEFHKDMTKILKEYGV